jgi:hypothetical protein
MFTEIRQALADARQDRDFLRTDSTQRLNDESAWQMSESMMPRLPGHLF